MENSIGNLRQRFHDETRLWAFINPMEYIKWLENQLIDPEYRHQIGEPEREGDFFIIPEWLSKEEFGFALELWKDTKVAGVKYLMELVKPHIKNRLKWSADILRKAEEHEKEREKTD